MTKAKSFASFTHQPVSSPEPANRAGVSRSADSKTRGEHGDEGRHEDRLSGGRGENAQEEAGRRIVPDVPTARGRDVAAVRERQAQKRIARTAAVQVQFANGM